MILKLYLLSSDSLVHQQCKRHQEAHTAPSFLTHEVGHYLAHGSSKDKVLEDAGDEGEGHAEDGHHQIADGERQQEGVGHGAHALIDRQHHDDEQVAYYTQDEDE